MLGNHISVVGGMGVEQQVLLSIWLLPIPPTKVGWEGIMKLWWWWQLRFLQFFKGIIWATFKSSRPTVVTFWSVSVHALTGILWLRLQQALLLWLSCKVLTISFLSILILVPIPSESFIRSEIHKLTLSSDISVYSFSSPLTPSYIWLPLLVPNS